MLSRLIMATTRLSVSIYACQIMCHDYFRNRPKTHGAENGGKLRAEKTYLEFIARSKIAFRIRAVLIILAFSNFGADGKGSHNGEVYAPMNVGRLRLCKEEAKRVPVTTRWSEQCKTSAESGHGPRWCKKLTLAARKGAKSDGLRKWFQYNKGKAGSTAKQVVPVAVNPVKWWILPSLWPTTMQKC